MNYLSHILLSGENPMILVGNFMGDGVKGNDFENYPGDLKKGILLHRQIDSFMDSNPLVMEGKKRLHPTQHKFAGVVIDVFYDYFLAKHWKKYTTHEFEPFISNSYLMLEQHVELMPEISQFILGRMASSNWLIQYKEVQGIDRALTGLSSRTKYPNNMANAAVHLVEFEKEFDQEFLAFFPEMINHCKKFLES
jgi:acyl carrier protein phosphodiesterase